MFVPIKEAAHPHPRPLLLSTCQLSASQPQIGQPIWVRQGGGVTRLALAQSRAMVNTIGDIVGLLSRAEPASEATCTASSAIV